MNGFLKFPNLSHIHRYSTPVVLIAVMFGLIAAPNAQAEMALYDLIFKTKNVEVSDEAKGLTVPGDLVSGKRPETIKTIRMDATAYTSRPQETDGSPFITADGSVVRDGIIASNVLPFGTKVRLPTVYGEKIFVVRDRMNTRYSYRLDVWMDDYNTMMHFGLKRGIPVEVVEMGDGKKNWDQWKGRSAELHAIGAKGPALPPLPQPYMELAMK